MINFKFVRSQFKNIRILFIVFFVALIILLLPGLTMSKYFANYSETIVWDSSSSGRMGASGAIEFLNYTFFGPPGLILMFAFGLILSHILVSKEVDRGYLASWLTTPMSRRTILNSKLFVLLSSVATLYLSGLIIQMIFMPIKFPDFNAELIGYTVLANFAFLILALLWSALSWTLICVVNKSVWAISIACAVSVVFIVCNVLVLFASIPGSSFAYLKSAKYFTIASFFNSPFQIGEVPNLPNDLPPGHYLSIAPFLSIKAVNFAWQLPTMVVLALGFFFLANSLWKKRDLHL